MTDHTTAKPRHLLSSAGAKILALPALLLAVLVLGVVAIVIDDQVRGSGSCKSAIYDKSAVVFNAVTICGTSGVSTAKLDHAAAVAAQWLDNDQDGTVDEPRLLEQLQASDPVVLMTENGISLWPGIRTLIARRGLTGTQDLGAQETDPADGGRDAGPEEIHHLLMNAGWQRLWPDVFSEREADQSVLYRAWQSAEADQLYAYDDPTCDSSCKVTEFVYLATAAYLGSSADLQTDELRIPDAAGLRELAPTVVEIFESGDYVYPTKLWPNGDYPFAENIQRR